VVFPVSAAIHRETERYREVLESYSRLLLNCIDWEATPTGNVLVKNETADYYRYFDATTHAEFLYRCVEQTIERDVPEEIAYLQSYDEFSQSVQTVLDVPNQKIDLLHTFLRQGKGHLSARARSKEFASLTNEEVLQIEALYAETLQQIES
jgi:hypothetical protein